VGDTGHRQVNTLPRQQLQRAQLVTGAGDSHGFIQGKAAEDFKLAQRGGAVKGDGRANARDHGVKKGQLAAFIMNGRCRRTDIHITGQRIEDLDEMTAANRGFAQAFARPERSIPGQYGYFHPAPL